MKPLLITLLLLSPISLAAQETPASSAPVTQGELQAVLTQLNVLTRAVQALQPLSTRPDIKKEQAKQQRQSLQAICENLGMKLDKVEVRTQQGTSTAVAICK